MFRDGLSLSLSRIKLTQVAEVLHEFKSIRNDLTGPIRKLNADLTDLQRDTNARLSKIESVMPKIGEQGNLNNKAQVLEERGRPNKGFLLTSTKSTVEAIDSRMEDSFKKLQESNKELKNKLEHLE